MFRIYLSSCHACGIKRMFGVGYGMTKESRYTLAGTLHLVSTPIGCLDDISHRALSVLNKVDVILAEDTRTTGMMLLKYGISNQMESLNQENEASKIADILSLLKSNKSVALVSDSGTPIISDPGALLVRYCHSNSIPVTAIPGANAALTALICSGFYSTPYRFVGFIKRSGSERLEQLHEIANCDCTTILYESNHRIINTINELAQIIGRERRICICRELTKMYETISVHTLQEASTMIDTSVLKGEFTLVLEGLREYSERNNLTTKDDSYDKESVNTCILALQKEGIDKEVIMRIMKESFNLTKSDIKRVLYHILCYVS